MIAVMMYGRIRGETVLHHVVMSDRCHDVGGKAARRFSRTTSCGE